MTEIPGVGAVSEGVPQQAVAAGGAYPSPAVPTPRAQSVPVEAAPPPALGQTLPKRDVRALREGTTELNKLLKNFNRKVRFEVMEGTHLVVAHLVDRDTNEVVRTIPPESMLRVLERIDEAIGLLVDEAR
jgi:uncharacterized FlaG/YvyC family protein